MKVKHDREGDVLTIFFNDREWDHNHVVNDDLIIGLDADGNIVHMQILGVSHNSPDPNIFEYLDITNPRYYQQISKAEKSEA